MKSTRNAGESAELIRIDQWVPVAAKRLRASKLHFGHGADSPMSEAAWIAAHVCRLSPRNIERHIERHLSVKEHERADLMVEQRIQERIPLAYLLKEAWLGRHRFYVDSRVIVPRSFIAASLDDRLQPWIAFDSAPTRGLDMCTGSGCLAILMAKAFPSMNVDAADLSDDALAVASINCKRAKLDERIQLIKSDLFDAIPRRLGYDLIVSNPPYVTRAAMQSLPDEYLHEPEQALFGGSDGLTFIKRIVTEARKFLRPKGFLILEVGHNRKSLERAFPRVPMMWLDTPGGTDMVVLIEAAHLPSSTRR